MATSCSAATGAAAAVCPNAPLPSIQPPTGARNASSPPHLCCRMFWRSWSRGWPSCSTAPATSGSARKRWRGWLRMRCLRQVRWAAAAAGAAVGAAAVLLASAGVGLRPLRPSRNALMGPAAGWRAAGCSASQCWPAVSSPHHRHLTLPSALPLPPPAVPAVKRMGERQLAQLAHAARDIALHRSDADLMHVGRACRAGAGV